MKYVVRYFDWFAALSLCLIFAYCAAPSVTFEDSGELITAVYSWGIPHEPGYPLFVLLAKIFTWIPVGSIAYRVNLFSAVTSALGLVFMFSGLKVLVRRWWPSMGSSGPWLVTLGGVMLWTAGSPAYFSQAVITEVYGLNNMLAGSLIWIAARWVDDALTQDRPQQEKLFFLYCFVTGLALTNHHTAGVFIPFFAVLAVSTDRKFFSTRRLMRGAGWMVVGLLPYVYLPLASAADPVMDWGNPESWTNFWRVIGRHQYGLDVATARTARVFWSQIASPYHCLVSEFTWIGVALGCLGFFVMWKQDRRWFFAALLFHVMTGPFIGYLSNVNLTAGGASVIAEQKALISVLFLPFYLLWAMAIGLAFAFAGQRWTKQALRFGLAIACVAGGIWRVQQTAMTESKRDYRFADRFAGNLEKLIEPNAMVLANWDPFVFPMMYYQHVEGRFAHNVFIDTELLRRSWYIAMLRRWYPDVMARCRASVDLFLSAVRPFEDGKPFDPNFIQARYIGMINDLIDRHADRAIYMTCYAPIRPLEQGIATRYRWEPCYVAYRLKLPQDSLTPVDPSIFDFSEFTNGALLHDRMSNMLRNYFAIQFAERGLMFTPHNGSAASWHFDQALKLAESEPIRQQIRLLQKSPP